MASLNLGELVVEDFRGAPAPTMTVHFKPNLRARIGLSLIRLGYWCLGCGGTVEQE